MSHRVHLSIAFTRLPKSLGTSIVISEALIVLAGCAEEITQPATPRLTFLGIPRVTLWNPRFSTPGNPARKEAMHQKTLWAQTSSDIWQFSNVSTTGASTGHHSLTNSNIQKAFRFMLHIYFKRKLKRKFFWGGGWNAISLGSCPIAASVNRESGKSGNPPGEDLQILLQLRLISQWPETVFFGPLKKWSFHAASWYPQATWWPYCQAEYVIGFFLGEILQFTTLDFTRLLSFDWWVGDNSAKKEAHTIIHKNKTSRLSKSLSRTFVSCWWWDREHS